MSRSQRSAGRRKAERPPSRAGVLLERLRTGRGKILAVGWTLWGTVVVGAVVLAGLNVVGIGPAWLDQAAAVTISTCFAAFLSLRTGGRALVFGCVALALGLLAVVSGAELLRTGAAVMTSVVAGVLAVMATVPAVRFRHAVREAAVAIAISAVGALGVVGYRPVVDLGLFDYTALTLAFVLALALVYSLGAGLHGLGRRGAIAVLVGTLAMVAILAYTELLRRYGAEGFVENVLQVVRWMREHLGAAPRPVQAMLGVPALVWGCHVRARRRQGWWLCVFGVALTTSVAGLLVNPATGWLEAVLIVGYSFVAGIVIGYGIIRIDLALTGQHGRRARRAEEQTAMRPEPARFSPLM
ncbi:hypothetical protein [Nocardioides sp. AE5]|uniref:hypothetical protein n=1 Tax=Nocardioides sp. AE5 TaxID=2962573 RepID=UPI002882CC80|nr:hypothetical protein [Nocardioides sp. AE5]MDT0202511.1 hypothetical protein [Nocardioides sp. AE5]